MSSISLYNEIDQKLLNKTEGSEQEVHILKEIEVKISEQNETIQKLFYLAFSDYRDKIIDALSGKDEFIFHGEEKSAIWIRKLSKKVEVLVTEGNTFSGAFKYVRKMRDVMTGTLYALAVNKSSTKQSILDTQEEAEKCKKIHKKVRDGVIEVHSVITRFSKVGILMEYCEGGTFADFKNRKDVRFEEYVTKVIEIGKILQKIHSALYTHKDLRDDNIMFTANNDVRFIDFGCAGKLVPDDVDSLDDFRNLDPEFCADLYPGDSDFHDKFRVDLRSYGCLLNHSFDLINSERSKVLSDSNEEESNIKKGLNIAESMIKEAYQGLSSEDNEKSLDLPEAISLLENALKKLKLSAKSKE